MLKTSLAAVLALAAALPASGQCIDRWITGPEQYQPGLNTILGQLASVNGITSWDPDGSGPSGSKLIIGGNFAVVHGVELPFLGQWDGDHFVQIGGAPNGVVNALTNWRPPGSTNPHLIAAGGFTKIGADTYTCIARWDGEAWNAMAGLNNQVLAVMPFDFDGPGPQPERLVAAGEFTAPGSRIAYWNGSSWQPLSTGMNNSVRALASWDADGPGPGLPQLIAGGMFTTASGVDARGVARWDGSQWQPLGAGLPNVNALASWDPDGDGPQTPRLALAGQFLGRVATWNGSAWSICGSSGLTTPAGVDPARVMSLANWDPDGSGPQPDQLIASGFFTLADGQRAMCTASWNGSAWSEVGGGWWAYSMHPAGLTASYSWQEYPDEPAQLVVAGPEGATAEGFDIGVTANGIARWNGEEWLAFGRGTGGGIARLPGVYDFDGPGPRGPEMLMMGNFAVAGERKAFNITSWTGAGWSQLCDGGLFRSSLVDAVPFDPDGDGPAPIMIFASGSFPALGGIDDVAIWDGSGWIPSHPGTGQHLLKLFDRDGAGPLRAQPVLTGASGVFQVWDGSWSALPGGAIGGAVRAFELWDRDGAGPLEPTLVAVGLFPGAVAYWTSSGWVSLAAPADEYRDIITWDADGPGPQAPRLVTLSGNVPYLRQFDGAQWTTIDNSFDRRVHDIVAFDADGPGPLNERLIAVGEFTFSGGTPLYHAGAWDGSSWSELGGGFEGTGASAAVLDPDGSGPHPGEIVVYEQGLLSTPTVNRRRLVRFTPTGMPWIVTNPVDTAAAAGSTVTLTATPATGYDFAAPLTFQWRRNGEPISDGPSGASPGGGAVSGATGSLSGSQIATLTIAAAAMSDSGEYDCVISNVCNSATTKTAMLAVTGTSCRVDLNHDGVVDFADYLEFLNLYEALDLAVDFNGDGLVDFLDYLEFLNLFDAGC